MLHRRRLDDPSSFLSIPAIKEMHHICTAVAHQVHDCAYLSNWPSVLPTLHFR